MLRTSATDVFTWNNFSSDCRAECLTEGLIFFLQDSGASEQFGYFANKMMDEISDHNEVYLPLSHDNNLLNFLRSFMELLKELNACVQNFLFKFLGTEELSEFGDAAEIRQTVQGVISSVVFPLDLRTHLLPIFEAYLSLELEASETDNEVHDVFTSVISNQMDQEKLQLLEMIRELRQSKCAFNFESFYQPICISFAKSALTCRVKILCSENYSERFLSSVLAYKDVVMKQNWLTRLFSHSMIARKLQSRLSDELVYGLFYEVRKSDIFSLIIEYPDSTAALLDLGECLDHVSFREDLITHLTKEVEQRLLHPGVHTEQILVAYSYLVQALRLIDSSFLTQDVVCRPVSLCLRKREDAVRCIVDKLISAPDDDKDEDLKGDEQIGTSTELHSELLLPKPLEVAPADGAEDSDADVVAEDPPFDFDLQGGNQEEGDSAAESNICAWGSSWQPDPVEARNQNGMWRRKMDLLSMLVSIYGSKKAFLVEYRQLLSQRLLKQRTFHTARELRNLELLKLRFGEQNLHECEVMLKDIRDSKRIASLMCEMKPTTPRIPPARAIKTENDSNNPIRSKSVNTELGATHVDTPFPLCVFILSKHYWPELLDDGFKLPDDLQNTFEEYKSSFQRLKGNRTLSWIHKLGLVNIDLELGDQTAHLDVTPLQAAVIFLFTKKRMWCLRDLAQKLETSLSNVRHALQTFIQLGFVRPRPIALQCTTASDGKRLGPGHKSASTDCFEVYEAVHHAPSNASRVNPSAGQINFEEPSTSTQWIYPGQMEEFEDETCISSVRERREKELQVFWSYIVAMLTNLGGLSLDRIHTMLRMFALGSTSTLECNRDELRQFLDKKIRESVLTFDGETYKLMKSDV